MTTKSPPTTALPVVLSVAALTLPRVEILPPVMLPVAVINPVVAILLPAMLPITFNGLNTLPDKLNPAALTFAATRLPVTDNWLVVLLNDKPALAPTKPASLNNTCVFEPVTAILPEMFPITLPIKFGAVMLPTAVIVPPVCKFPLTTFPDTLSEFSVPTAVIFGCNDDVTAPAVTADVADPALTA